MASSEWTLWHLTPKGWVAGDQQFDTGPMVSRAVPADRVLSSVYKETSSGYSMPAGGNTEIWRGSDERLITSLLNEWDAAPSEL